MSAIIIDRAAVRAALGAVALWPAWSRDPR